MTESAFYNQDELEHIGFNSYGSNVFVSRNASIYNPASISLGSHVRIDDFCVLSGGQEIRIGDYVHIACFCGLYGGSGIRIGNYSTLSSRVAIYSESDDFSGTSLTNPTLPRHLKPNYLKGMVNMHDHIVVGTNSTILPGVTIYEGAAIGAHSLVKNNCKSWTINGGVPSKFISNRSKKLLKLIDIFKNNS